MACPDCMSTLISLSHIQVRHSWEVAGREKEYSTKVKLKNKSYVTFVSFLTKTQLRQAESTLSDVVFKLRSAINPTCPVNKLPPEILTRCFLYLIRSFPLTVGPSGRQHDSIYITHVCKYWRAVAFGYPRLWDTIDFTRSEILDMHVKHSGSRPLEVCLQRIENRFRREDGVRPPSDAVGLEMLNLLVPLRRRIHSFIIHTSLLPNINRPCGFFERPLPELETLSIISDTGWEPGNVNDNSHPQKRLRVLFGGKLPRLRQLFIPEYTPWPDNNFKDLTLICLYNQLALEGELPELMQMLRGSPNLEELYIRLHEDGPWIDNPPDDIGPIFPARSLRKLRLHNFSPLAISCFLSTMILQPNGIAVNISNTATTTGTFAQILPLFPREFALGSTEKLEVYHESKNAFGIMFCCTGGSLRLSGSLEWEEGEEDPTEPAISSFRYIYQECAQNLKELWIHTHSRIGEGYIFDNFSCFNLEKLVLLTASDVSDRLCEVLNPENYPDNQYLPAPRLRSLEIRGISKQLQLEHLISLYRSRYKTDHPLQDVSVKPKTREGSREGIPEWMTRLCGSLPMPIHIHAWEEFDEHLLEFPGICIDDEKVWWPSWEESIDSSTLPY